MTMRTKIAAGATAVAALAAAVLLNVGEAEAATNPCGGSSVGSKSIMYGSSKIGKFVVTQSSSTSNSVTYCLATIHLNATDGVSLFTGIGAHGPQGTGLVKSATTGSSVHTYVTVSHCSSCQYETVKYHGIIDYRGGWRESVTISVTINP